MEDIERMAVCLCKETYVSDCWKEKKGKKKKWEILHQIAGDEMTCHFCDDILINQWPVAFHFTVESTQLF